MIIPIINLNGTDGQDLLRQQSKVLARLRGVANAMAEAYPHGRDYQTMAAGAFNIAREEADERGLIINKLIEAYEAICIDLSDQIADRKR